MADPVASPEPEVPSLLNGGVLHRTGGQLPRDVFLILLLAVLFLVALLSVGWTVYVANVRQDESERRREQQIAETRVADLRSNLSRNVLDYANWDDAVENLVLAFDRDWAARNVGSTVFSDLHYQVSLVIGSDDRPIYGQVDGQEDAALAAAAMGDELADLLREVRGGSGTPPEVVTAALNGEGGLLIAAAAGIKPESGSAIHLPEAPSGVLVFARRLNASYLRGLEEGFGLTGLTIVGPDAPVVDRTALDLLGPDGQVAARLIWSVRQPGREQLAWLLPTFLAMAIAIGVFTFLALRGVRHSRALHASEARLRDFVDVSSDWLWEADSHLRLAWLSSGFQRSTGIDPGQRLGQSLTALRVDDAIAADWDGLHRRLRAERPFRDFTYGVTDPSGQLRILQISAQPKHDGQGRFLGYRGTGRDITREWQADQRLRQSENRFRSLVENLRGIVFMHGAAGSGPEGYGPAGVEFFGAETSWLGVRHGAGTDEPVDSWTSVIHPDDRARHQALQRRLRNTGQPFSLEFRLRHPDSREERWARQEAWAVADPQDGQTSLDGFIIDVTEQHQREAALAAVHDQLRQQNEELQGARWIAEEANRAKTEFLAAMSHEIRTPMTGVLGMADLLSAEGLTPAQLHYVETIRRSGTHLLSIINDILDFSRIEAGRLELEQLDFAPRDLLEQVHALLAPQARERGLALDLAVDLPKGLVVRGDPTRIRQVLVNLVSNGLKFTSAGSVMMHVAGHRANHDQVRLRFEVRDTGIGIPQGRQPDLFQAFVQADRSTSRHFGGSGLGLAICKRLVEAMHGEIGLASEVGQGSTFWFELELPPGSADRIVERSGAPFENVRPLRVLVVDDVAANRELLAAMLGRYGHVIDVAEDGGSGLQKASRFEYDLILMDVQMPVMDGLQATRSIRRLPPPACDVPIFALTANVMASEQDRFLTAGMDRCLTKPVVWADLLAALAMVAAGDGRVAPAAGRGSTADDPPARAAPPAGAADTPLFDRNRLSMNGKVPPEIYGRLLVRGLDGAAESCVRLRDSLGDPEALAREAHRLRGTAGTFGLLRMANLAGAVEARLAEGRPCDDLVTLLQETLAQTRAEAARDS